MAILVGIDEAGYGPLLGPLTLSASTFELPDDLIKTDHWKLLSKSITKKPQKALGRLVIADSKKVYKRRSGLGHLQRSVLAALNCLGHTPKAISDITTVLCPACVTRLNNYPWYKQLDSINLETSASDIAIASSAFNQNLLQNDMKFLAINSVCFDVAHYNKLVAAMNNKASVLLYGTSQLIQLAFNRHKNKTIQIIVDRQGGRVNYVPWLRQIFPDLDLKILRQDAKDSSYELTSPETKMRIHFAVSADEKFLPVSLASLASKYLRELLVTAINRYFAAHCPDLKPTAGYWQDGQRFIADLKKYPDCPPYNPSHFIRSR